jgi:hypothetical protein
MAAFVDGGRRVGGLLVSSAGHPRRAIGYRPSLSLSEFRARWGAGSHGWEETVTVFLSSRFQLA